MGQFSVTAQNSKCKCFLHATNRFYPSSMAPSMRVNVMGQTILCTQTQLVFQVPGWQVIILAKPVCLSLEHMWEIWGN